MLTGLSRIDEATEQASLDFQDLVGTEFLDPDRPAHRYLAVADMERGRHPVPRIVFKGLAALAAAKKEPELTTVLRELWTPEMRRRSLGIDESVKRPPWSVISAGLERYEPSVWTCLFDWLDPTVEDRAMETAAVAHRGQLRKEGGVPYIAHPLAVALHLARSGYGEQCIAAALLHDVIEDTEWTEAMVAEVMGAQAAPCLALVRFATEPPKEVPWRTRKAAVVAKLAGATHDERALVIADNSHNLRSLLRALRGRGEAAWTVLRHGRAEQSWFAHALAEAVRDEAGEPFASYVATVEEAVREGWLDAA